ncbi:Ig-like domain-containing protein [Mesobacterium pallidum]|uniref:Ig-like domain-containing protein n=1 Tax=Mesobacterium pallidum TaxID=2872037 RepID=UPI001EE16C4E|nr:Ig-like domain-containing protein [Mesobacterium pallidum]
MSLNTTCATLDFIFLQDLSGSYADDLPILKAQISNVIATVEDIDPFADFGVASFIDKPISPFGATTDYVYQTHLAVTSDNDAVIAAMQALTTRSGADGFEAQLSGLLQVALRTTELGYREGTKRIVMLSTDAGFHQEGDFASAGTNNGDAVLDGGGLGEDYPSIAMVAAALAAANIFPVFSVTAATRATYEALVADLGTGAVVELTANSSNFSDAVRLAIAKSCGHVTHEGTEGDDDIHGTETEDGIYGNGGDDSLRGLRGDDVVDGGSGDDTCEGGSGRDDIRGGSGRDDLRGGWGADTLSGGLDDDLLRGDGGADTFILNPSDGHDTVMDFENGTDVIDLSAFTRLEGFNAVMNAVQAGLDVTLTLPGGTTLTLKGFSLADFGLEDVLLNTELGAPLVTADTAEVTASGSVSIDVLANDLDPDGTPLTITGTSAAAHGTVTVEADGTLTYAATPGYIGTDVFTYTATNGTAPATTTVTVTIHPNLTGTSGNDYLVDDNGSHLMRGFRGHDTLVANGGDDTVLGHAGRDSIVAGLGNDSVKGGGGADTIDAGVATATVLATDDDTVGGGAGGDLISTGDGMDSIHGDNGNDTIHAGDSDDEAFGDAGDDMLYGEGGGDRLAGNAGNDSLYGAGDDDRLDGGTGDDLMEGGDGKDEFLASGNAALGSDNDTMTGGSGADTFVWEFRDDRNNSGFDVITDFEAGIDEIQLDGDVNVTLTDTADGALIANIWGDMILVEDVTVAEVTPWIVGL